MRDCGMAFRRLEIQEESNLVCMRSSLQMARNYLGNCGLFCGFALLEA